MNNISDIMLALPKIIGVNLDTRRRVPELAQNLQDIFYHMQMAFYWLKHAKQELKDEIQSTELTQHTEEPEHKLVIPTLLGPPEQFDYMKRNLSEVSTETYQYYNDTPLPQGVKHKMEQAYNNMMLALFNTELSMTYYEQIRNREPLAGSGPR